MAAAPRIDLHAHSAASDGTDLPQDLVRRAAEAGLDVVALTDHDTFAGIDAAAAELPLGLALVPGVEISCVAFEGERRISLHLLGYLPDRTFPPLRDRLREVVADRDRRGQRMVDLLRGLGVEIGYEQVLAAARGGVVGRPHVASALVQAGAVADLAEAFSPRWIGHGGPAYVPKQNIPVVEAIGLVRDAGGVPVFAHPLATRRGPVVSDQTIADLAAAGLRGLEVDHVDQFPDERAHLRGLAADLGLLTTGSSDYHGLRKPVRLGENTTDPSAYLAILEQAAAEPLVA